MNKAVTLRNTLPAVCSAIAGQKGVKIIWQGPPRTDGSTIWSNPLPVDADADTVKVVVGDIDHECGHVRFSDFELVGKKKPGLPELQACLWNALEDTFIERRLGDDYLGCQQTLAESAEIAVAKGHCRTGEKGPADALQVFCDAWGRKNVLRQGVDKILDSSRSELVKHLDEKGVVRLEALLATKLFSANSTAETLHLSGAIIKLMKDIQEEQEQPPPPEPEPQEKPSDPQGEEGDDQGQDDSQGDGQGGNDPSDQGQGGDDSNPDPQGSGGNGQPEGGSPDGSSPQPQSGSDTGNGNSPSDNAGTGDGAGRGGSARQILEDANVDTGPAIDRKGASQEMAAQAAAQGNFVFDPRTVTPPPVGDNLARYNALKAAVSGHIAQLSRRLAVEFQTKRRTRSVIAEEGRLDGRRLHHALTGETRIYRHKVVTQSPKPAVSLVLDCSGSMGFEYVGSKICPKDDIILATQAVIAIAEVCAVMGVPFEVVTFAGGQIGAIKTFDHPLTRARGRIGAIDAGGGTPTAEALWIAGNRLVGRREERKILMLVTDGDPDNMPSAKQVAGLIERSGIELYGIGLGTNAIRQVCQKSGVIMNANDLAPAILTALAERMLAAA